VQVALSEVSLVDGDIDLGAGNNNTNVASGARLQLENSNTLGSNLNVDGALAITEPLSVTGDATFGADSTIAVDVSDITTQSTVDLVTSSGAVTNNGVALEEVGNSLLLDFDLEATPEALQLQSSAADIASSVQDTNIANFATSLQNAIAAQATGSAFNDVTSSLNALANVGEFENAAAALLPSVNLGITREIFNAQSNAFDSAANRFHLNSPNRSALWHDIYAGTSDRDGGSQLTESGYDANNFGITIGADTLFSDNFRAGLAFTYSNIDIDDSGLSGQNTEIDYYGIQLYGNYQRNKHFVSGQIAYGLGQADSSRNSDFGSIQSDSDLDQFSAKISTGYKFQVRNQHITPFASFGKDAQLNIKAAWYHDFADDERDLSVSFNNEAFNLRGIGADRNSFELEAGLGIQLRENLLLDLRYKGTYSSDFESHAGQYGLTWTF